MAQKRKHSKELTTKELTSSIRSDWGTLLGHLNALGVLLLSMKKVRIFLRVFIAILCFGLLFWVRSVYDNQPIVGDQPHYVLMDFSLIHDGDFNLANNFANHDSDTFGIYPPDGLTPDGQVGPGQVDTPNHQYSIHGVGIPLLLAPGYAIDGSFGMQVEMLLIAVAVLYVTYYWSKIITKSVKYSFLASLALFISYVFYGLAGYIFPDVIIGGIIAATFIIMAKAPNSVLWQFVAALLLGFGFLVHYKVLAFAAPVALVWCYITWTRDRKLPYVALATMAFFGALLLYLTHHWFGIWNPSGVLKDLGVGIHPESTINNISAVLFDAARGLMPNAPILLLVFVGLPIWFRKDWRMVVMILASIALSVAGFVMFNDWRGGDSPAGRYAMNFLPVLMPAAALTMQYLTKAWHRAIIAALFVVTLAITLYYLHIELGWLGVPGLTPQNSPIFWGSNLAFDRWFPNFDAATHLMGHYDGLKAVAGYVALIGAMVYGYFATKRVSPESVMTRPKS
jgi:hypothetical protein